MIDISLNNIKVNYGFGNVLDNISLEINSGEIISLIGNNGSGKTTLIKLIASKEKPTSGIIAIRKKASIGYLSQQLETIADDISVKQYLYNNLGNILFLGNKLKKYEKILNNSSGKYLEEAINKYTSVQEEYISNGGYEIEERIGKIVKGFNIENLLNKKYNNLSGGEKRIVTFASIMVNNPDILLLDEPTNHLDIDTLEWLEQYLKKYKGTIIIISHDRYLLNRISNKIVLLENGKIDIYNGNYNYYLEEKEKRKDLILKNYNTQQKQISSMKESIKKLREFGKLGNDERFFKRAKSIEKRLDKIERIDKPRDNDIIPLEFTTGIRTGKDVLTIKDLSIMLDNIILFDNVELNIKYQEHVCVLGKNGSGKSTLIKEILNGNNNIVMGTNINIGYIPQEIIFDNNNRVYDIARKYYNGDESHLRSLLNKFLFSKDNIFKKVSNLSGGEKVRLKLFCLMQQNINFLILDEPTNHIDISTREILEDTLKNYEGTILFVSHDRMFINSIATKIIAIENNKLVEYVGNYEDYKRYKNIKNNVKL